jgi:hypothetical protein
LWPRYKIQDTRWDFLSASKPKKKNTKTHLAGLRKPRQTLTRSLLEFFRFSSFPKKKLFFLSDMREKILRLSWEWGPDVVHERSEQRYCAIEKESWMGKGLKLGWELEPLLESNGCYALGFRRFARPGKLRQTSGRLHSRGTVDGRRPITVGGGGGYLLMGKGKSQKMKCL